MAGILLRAAFCIQHNFSEVHPSCRVCQLTPLHLLYERGRATLRVPSPWRGIWGTRVWGCRHKAAVSARHSVPTWVSLPSPDRLSGAAFPRAHRRGAGARAAMLLWAEGQPSCTLQTRTQDGHRVGPWGVWPEGSMRASDAHCSWWWVSASRLALFQVLAPVIFSHQNPDVFHL